MSRVLLPIEFEGITACDGNASEACLGQGDVTSLFILNVAMRIFIVLVIVLILVIVVASFKMVSLFHDVEIKIETSS